MVQLVVIHHSEKPYVEIFNLKNVSELKWEKNWTKKYMWLAYYFHINKPQKPFDLRVVMWTIQKLVFKMIKWLNGNHTKWKKNVQTAANQFQQADCAKPKYGTQIVYCTSNASFFLSVFTLSILLSLCGSSYIFLVPSNNRSVSMFSYYVCNKSHIHHCKQWILSVGTVITKMDLVPVLNTFFSVAFIKRFAVGYAQWDDTR